jgi:hypothetical protein
MAEVEKLAVYDSRIVQERPRYGITKGGLSVSNSPFKAIAASSSQQSFNINVPSQNVFLSREVQWTAGCDLQVSVNVAGSGYAVAPVDANTPQVLSIGKNVSLCAFPLHSCVSTMTATINDTTSVINTSDVLVELLRMVNQKKNRLQRTTPTMLDKYAVYDESGTASNNPISNYNSATDYDNMPNGAFWDVVFTDAAGGVLSGNGFYAEGTGQFIRFVNGVPVLGGQGAAGDVGALKTSYTLFVRFRATEKLVLSPFIFSEECGDEVGLFGINNIQFVMNFKQPSKLLRLISNYPLPTDAGATRAISNITYRTSAPWQDATINCLFITPSLDLRLPPKSVVPYLEYPRYLTSFPSQTIVNGGTFQAQSNTIVLPQIPDMLIIYAKATTRNAVSVDTPVFGDFYLPPSKISINFDNYSGLLSSHTTEQLYNATVDAGLEMDWNTWNGRGYGSPLASPQSGRISAVGGFLCLRFGIDIPLQASQAAGVIGNYTLQFNVDINNRSGADITGITLFTLCVNSGFFETQSGSSRIVKGPITESDVINTTAGADALTRSQLERMVGGSFWSKLGTALNKAKDVLLMPEVRKMVKQGARSSGIPLLQRGADVAEKLGFGMTGGMMDGGMSCHSGGAMTGGQQGRTGGRRKGNLKALM